MRRKKLVDLQNLKEPSIQKIGDQTCLQKRTDKRHKKHKNTTSFTNYPKTHTNFRVFFQQPAILICHIFFVHISYYSQILLMQEIPSKHLLVFKTS